MNFSEFKKLLGADPWTREPEALRARQTSAEFEQFANDTEVFERKLQSALLVTAPEDLLASITDISKQAHQKRSWMPLALAASVLIAVSAIGMVWKQSNQWDSVEAYLADHYSQDGVELIARATHPVSAQDIAKIMASFDASVDASLAARVRFIKFCPTPEGRGAHMVINTKQGLVTVIFMPKTQVKDGEVVEFNHMHAYLVNLEHGSAAIISNSSQSAEYLESIVKSSLKTGLVGA